MPIKKPTILICLSLVLAILIGGSFVLASRNQPRPKGLARLNQLCNSGREQDGFGVATIGDADIRDQSGQLTKACRLKLRPGSTLHLLRVALTSQNLVIEDNGPPSKKHKGQPSKIIIEHSSLSGPQSGLQITLRTPNSSITLENNQIDYGLSAAAAVGANDRDVDAKLTADNNTISSLQAESEGIILSTTGKGWYTNNTFHLSPEIGTALLAGTDCWIQNSINSNQTCHGN